MNFNKADLQREVFYKTSRSGGKGGQNVNKVATKVELLFNINSSVLLDEEQKERISLKLGSRLNRDGLLQVVCDEERSQYLNKELALERLSQLLTQALHEPKKRKKTKVSKAAQAARLDGKKQQSAKKAARKKNFFD